MDTAFRFHLLTLALLSAIASSIPPAEAGVRTMSTAVETEQLSTSSPDWQLIQLNWAYERNRWKAGLGYTQQERFGLDDQEWSVEGKLHLSEGWTLVGRQTGSSTAEVLPHWSSGVEIYRNLASWVVIASARYAEYRVDSTQLWRLGAEHYWGPWVPGYTLGYGVLEGAAAGYSHQLKLDYFLTDTRWFGIGLVDGDEATRIGANRAVLAKVQGAYAKANWGLNTNWGVSLVISYFQQGDFYDRTGIRFGLDYRY